MPLRPVFLVLLGIGCSTTIGAHRPLSAAAVQELNEAVEGSEATVVLDEEPERAIECERAARAALRDSCESAPGQGNLKFEERCDKTRDCECGLTCQRNYCLGSSFKTPPNIAPSSFQARELKVASDTTQWLDLRSGTGDEWRQSTVSTASLKRISVLRRGRGAAEGLGLGLLIGGALGAALGAVGGSGATCFACNNSGGNGTASYAGVGAVVGLFAGAVIGPLVGVAVGHRTTVDFKVP